MTTPPSIEKTGDSWLDRIKVALGLAEPASIRDDIEDALQEPDEAKEFSPKERSLLINVLGLRDVRVVDVMTPRSQILGVSETAPLKNVLEVFRSTSHARLPVYHDTLDDPKGMIHIRDFVSYFADEDGGGLVQESAARMARPLIEANLLRPVLFVPPSTPALDLLVRMQSKRVHMAIIIDEYGETDGLVTMEDLVEVIVGDIEDEHDTPEETAIVHQADGSLMVVASAGLEEVAEALGFALENAEPSIDVDSIGGFVTALAGRVPQAGEISKALPASISKFSKRRHGASRSCGFRAPCQPRIPKKPSMIDRLVLAHHAILLAEGWKRALIATAAGAVAALALPPFGLFPVFALSFPVAIWLIDGTTADPARIPLRSFLAAAKDGWWFGYGYFLCGLWWIGAAFLVESDEFLWLMPFGVLGLPAGLAVFHALGFALARLFWSTGTSRIFAFAFGMGALEMARQFVFTGFPWNLFGHGFGASLIMGQFASLVGADGLTILALVIFSTPALLVSTASVSAKRVIRLAVGALALIAIFGTLRLMTSGGISNAPSGDSVAGVRLRLVQPNTAQRDAIAERDQSVVLARLFALSDRATGPNAMGIGDATHVFWPEAPFPSILTRDQKAMAEIARLLPAKTTLLTGAIRMEDGPPRRFYNSLEVFGARANILATYNKNHLVPFGEYLPFDRLLSAIGLRRFVQAPGNFTEGKGRKLLDVPGLPPVLALICYEAIFPHEINAANPRPGVIVNITNDAWFGQTIGPRQHFAQARLRAIEFGLPVIRTASTGISAVIDPYGRNVASLGSGIEGVIDAGLPKAITPTIYTEHGFVIVLALLFTVLIGSFASKRARTVRRSQN